MIFARIRMKGVWFMSPVSLIFRKVFTYYEHNIGDLFAPAIVLAVAHVPG